jgi:hypothetical protein
LKTLLHQKTHEESRDGYVEAFQKEKKKRKKKKKTHTTSSSNNTKPPLVRYALMAVVRLEKVRSGFSLFFSPISIHPFDSNDFCFLVVGVGSTQRPSSSCL